MSLEQKAALVIKELLQWDGQVETMLEDSDMEEGKVYDFDSNEAFNILIQFMNKYLI